MNSAALGRNRRVVLHIGAMKTGTTYLQGKAYANREGLEDQGVALPGRGWVEQVWAAQELIGMGRRDRFIRERNAGAWERLVTEMRGGEHRTSVLSMEFLAFADAEEARRAVASLADCEVRVVITVRDTAAVIPALWQTSVTSGGTTNWPRFRRVMAACTRADGRVGRLLASMYLPSAMRFREAVDIVRILRVWTEVLPPEQVHVVVVPRPGAPKERLWHLFCETFDADGTVLDGQPHENNESLGYPSAELVRRVNAAVDLEYPRDHIVVKRDLGLNGLGTRRRVERRARLDARTFAAALRWNGVVRQAIDDMGVTVHGDPADLPDHGAIVDYDVEDHHEPPSEEELLAAARHGIKTLRLLASRRSDRQLGRRRRRRFRRRLRRGLEGPATWSAAPDPVAAAVHDLVVYVEALIRLHRHWERHQPGRS